MPFFVRTDAECSPLSKEHLIKMKSLVDIVLVNAPQHARRACDDSAAACVLSSSRKLTPLRHSCLRVEHAHVQP